MQRLCVCVPSMYVCVSVYACVSGILGGRRRFRRMSRVFARIARLCSVDRNWRQELDMSRSSQVIQDARGRAWV